MSACGMPCVRLCVHSVSLCSGAAGSGTRRIRRGDCSVNVDAADSAWLYCSRKRPASHTEILYSKSTNDVHRLLAGK
eukprot:4466789-Amphidinium_carterae.1